MNKATAPTYSGFTLVELSIVLVIIGLIVGGVVGGQALIKSAKINKAITGFKKYEVAYNTFQLQYDAIPGDFNEARDFWGNDCPNYPSGHNCNGNGDGTIQSNGYELFHVFHHLGLAEVIPGKWSSEWLSNTKPFQPGITSPEGISGIGDFMFSNGGAFRGNSQPKNNRIILANIHHYQSQSGSMTAQDAKNIDKKMDDGKAFSGRIRGMQCPSGTGCSYYWFANTTYDYNLATDTEYLLSYFPFN